MSKYFFLLLLLTTVELTTAANTSSSSSTTTTRHLPPVNSNSPAPSPSTQPKLPLTHLPISPPPPRPVSIQSPPPPPPRSRPEYIQQQQLKNIIDALIGAGDFAAWANILFNPNLNSSISTPTTPPPIPTTATMFVPGNDALSRLSATATGAYSFDPFIIPYHILPQRLTFSELQLFKTQTRLPTLLPSKTVVITSNTPSHFTIDDSLITQPDIYSNAAVCVHGVANVLDYTMYGEAVRTPPAFLPPPPLPPADETLTPTQEDVSSSGDVVSGSGADFLIPFRLFCFCMQLIETILIFV